MFLLFCERAFVGFNCVCYFSFFFFFFFVELFIFLDHNQIQQLLSHFTRCAGLSLPTAFLKENLKLVSVLKRLFFFFLFFLKNLFQKFDV